MLLTVVVTTRNEEANIANCLRAFDAFRAEVELIVVDNASTDRTKEIAASFGARVFDKGPERCAQRNLGWREASAPWVVILDADMVMPEPTIREMLSVCENPFFKRRGAEAQSVSRALRQDSETGLTGLSRVEREEHKGTLPVSTRSTRLESTRLNPVNPVLKSCLNESPLCASAPLRLKTSVPLAYWIPEVRTGTGWRVKVRNFERSFYDGTCIDALRLFHKSVLEATGGYDENLTAGGEDWELDIRILATGAPCAVLNGHLVHNERQLTYRKLLEKKAYYTRGMEMYRAKWPDHPAVRRQFSPWYRFVWVFVEKGKWRRVLRHPLLFAGVMFERLSVGVVYLLNRGRG